MERTVDKTKKSNIKCEHCEHWIHADNKDFQYCSLTGVAKNYWNRCKGFEWSGKYGNDD